MPLSDREDDGSCWKVKGKKGRSSAPSCKEGLNRRAYLRTVAAAVVDSVHAPPAIDFLHAEQFQMPTARRFTVS
jgi:hypothetical protein